MNAADKFLFKHGFNSHGGRIKQKSLPGKRGKPKEKRSAIRPLSAGELLKSLPLVTQREKSEMSTGENAVAEYLLARDISFCREFSGPLLYNPATKKKLFVDFWLPYHKTVIEFDGIHHFKPVNGQYALDRQREKDRIKNEFCQTQGIRLIRIRGIKSIVQRLDKALSGI
jgi:hypothetical protein